MTRLTRMSIVHVQSRVTKVTTTIRVTEVTWVTTMRITWVIGMVKIYSFQFLCDRGQAPRLYRHLHVYTDDAHMLWKCWIISFEVCPTDKYVGEDPVSGGWSQSRPQVSRRYPPLVAISGQAGDNFLYFTFFVCYYSTLYLCPLVPAQ